MAHLTETYEITGGTRRLKRASGTLTLTATLIPVLFNASGGAQFLNGYRESSREQSSEWTLKRKTETTGNGKHSSD